MREFITYSIEGRVLAAGGYSSIFSEEKIAGLHAGENILFVSSTDNVTSEGNYVLDGVLELRATSGASWDSTEVLADGAAEIVLSGLPIPCTVYVDDTPIIVDDSTFEFSADAVGTYQIRLDEIDFSPETWTVTAI
jgi:hypothetical protein